MIQIGATTCGKPYGFYPAGQLRHDLLHDRVPGRERPGLRRLPRRLLAREHRRAAPASSLPGCSVADDFSHALGDPQEARLAAALAYRDSQSCPAAAASSSDPELVRGASATDGLTHKSPWRENRMYRR